jgi:hypothetical protein
MGGMLTCAVMVVYGVTVCPCVTKTAPADYLQVAFSIYLAQAMTLFFWSKGLDPEYVARQINYRLADLFIAHIACPCTLV